MDNMSPVNKCSDISKLRGIKIGGLNIRSLYRKIDDISLLLSDTKMDFLGLSESWLNSSVSGPEI